jgi:hypothetical protein
MPTQSHVNAPYTQTKTSHALVIQAGGQAIGAINSWQVQQNLGMTAVHEFGSFTGPYGDTFGAPYEQVPQNIDNMAITINRYDLYKAPMERVFGTSDLSMLSNDVGREGESSLFTLKEKWMSPNAGQRYAILYEGCWFTNIGRNLQTTGDRIVNVNATMVYTRRKRVEI